MDVRMPDGTIVTNVPEGTTQEELTSRLSAMRSSVNQPTTVAAQRAVQQDLLPSVEDRFSQRYNPQQSVGGYVANEVGNAAFNVLGIPQTMARSLPLSPLTAANTIGERARQAIGIPSLDRIKSVLGIQNGLKPPDPTTAGLTGLGIEVGQNFLLPGGTLPQRVLGGIGSYVGRTAGEPGGGAGELAGSVAGGVVAPAMLLGRAGALRSLYEASRGSMDDVAQRLRTNPQYMASVRDDVVNQLAKDLREDPERFRASFAEAQALEQAIPGLRLNLAQRFMAPNIIAKQRNVDVSQPVQAEMRFGAQQRALGEASLESPNARAMATGAIQDITEVSRQRLSNLSDEIAAASRDAEQISARVAHRIDVEDLGERALEIRQNLLQGARREANRLMNAATEAASNEGAVFDAAPIAARANELRAQPVWDDANFPGIFPRIQQWATLAEGNTQIPFEAIRDMRQAVNADIANALKSNSPNARSQLYNLRQLKDSIDDVVNNSGFPQTRDAYGAFNQYYRQEFAPRFLRGVNLAAERVGARGEPLLPGEKVFSQYFKKGNATNMARYLRLYGDNVEAMTSMRDAVIDRYAKEVIDATGNISPARHARFLDDYRQPLETLRRQGFAVGDELAESGGAFEAVVSRRAALEDEVSRINSDAVLKMLRDEFGAQAPETVASQVLGDTRRMRAVLSRMNESQARGFVDFLSDSLSREFRSGGGFDPTKIRSFLDDAERSRSYMNAMARVHGADAAQGQLTTLRRIADAAERINVTPPTKPSVPREEVNIFKDELQKRIGLSYAVIGNMVRAVVAGRVSPEWAALALGGQAAATIRQNLAQEVYKEVMSDPGTATRLLAMMNTTGPAFGGRVKQLLSHAPKLASYFLGLKEYPQLAAQAGANLAREQSDPAGQQ